MKRIAMRLVLVAAGIVAFANTAAACTSACQVVSPNCRRCVDTGSYTNQTCRNSGSCNCIYTNECFSLTLAQSIGVEPAEEPATCSTLDSDAAAFAEPIFAVE